MEQFTRFIVALESIASSLSALVAGGAVKTVGGSVGGETKAETKEETKPAGRGRGRAAPSTKKEPEVTREQMEAALSDLKEYIDDAEGADAKAGLAAAREVIQKVAGVKKMAEIPEDKFALVMVEAEKALEEYKANEGDGDDM